MFSDPLAPAVLCAAYVFVALCFKLAKIPKKAAEAFVKAGEAFEKMKLCVAIGFDGFFFSVFVFRRPPDTHTVSFDVPTAAPIYFV